MLKMLRTDILDYVQAIIHNFFLTCARLVVNAQSSITRLELYHDGFIVDVYEAHAKNF